MPVNPAHSKQWLLEKLVSNSIDTSSWGKGKAKSVEDFWNEVVSGETILQHDPLMRVVSVTQLIIRSPMGILFEIEQVFADGRTRPRLLRPSEKMKRGEHFLAAAERCLKEELGISRDRAIFDESTHKETREIKQSPSYPGLLTEYLFHTIEVKVQDLPTTDFWTDESPENSQDPVSKHHWDWLQQE